MAHLYDEMKKMDVKDLKADDDNDGVSNHFDEENDTPEGAPVDSRGRALDSDKDGLKDHEDPEPFSSPLLPIENGENVREKTMTPEEIETLIDNKLSEFKGGAGGSWYLPNVNFDFNSSRIKTDHYDKMQYVAEVMQAYPRLKVEVIGHADSRGSETANDKLSQQRAENAVKFLVEEHGISEDRFIMKYEGEKRKLVKDANNERGHQMNRRVEFKPVKS